MKVITIGRGAENDITINDTGVSRHHLQIIQHDDGRYTLSDFGSTNGTYVNGQRIIGQVPLNPGDMVQIGSTALPWRNYFSNGAPVPPTMGMDAGGSLPAYRSQASSNKLPIILGVAGAVVVVLVLVLVLFLVHRNHDNGSDPYSNGVSVRNVSGTINEPIKNGPDNKGDENKNGNQTNITGKWEWLSAEEVLVELADESEEWSRTTFTLELKDNGSTVRGNYYGGYVLSDVKGDSGEGGSIQGKWDGEKYIVTWTSDVGWGGSGTATLRVLSPQSLKWEFTTGNSGYSPDEAVLKKATTFEHEKSR